MTPILTDERKADILEYVQDTPGVTRKDLKTVLVNIDVEGQFLTDAMIDELLRKAKPKAEHVNSEKSHYKRAIRVRRSPETWRHLDNYPGYQISSHGRLRTVQRANADDVLKPRFSWHYGKVVMAYELRDKDGNRKARFVGSLMMAAGFLKAPQWRKKEAESPVK